MLRTYKCHSPYKDSNKMVLDSSNNRSSSQRFDGYDLDLNDQDRILVEIILPSLQRALEEIADVFPEDRNVRDCCLKISLALEKGACNIVN